MTKNPNTPTANPKMTELPVGTDQFAATEKLSRDAQQATAETMVNQARKPA